MVNIEYLMKINNKLNKKKLLECIFCSSKIIEKSIMSPMVSPIKSGENNLNFEQKRK